MRNEKDYYNEQYDNYTYSNFIEMEKHPFFKDLHQIIKDYRLEDKKCLEVGSGRGAFQDIVNDYTGTDLSGSVNRYYHKPFLEASADNLPFENDSFDFCWSYAVFEMIPEIQKSLDEIMRVCKPGGIVVLRPAWHCRGWSAQGYMVRPYSDFNLSGKIYKFLIPFLDNLVIRSVPVFIHRFFRHIQYLLFKRPMSFKYKRLKPNYETFWVSDSDACNSMDQHEVVLYYTSRGHDCLSHQTNINQFFVRSPVLIFKKGN